MHTKTASHCDFPEGYCWSESGLWQWRQSHFCQWYHTISASLYWKTLTDKHTRIYSRGSQGTRCAIDGSTPRLKTHTSPWREECDMRPDSNCSFLEHPAIGKRYTVYCIFTEGYTTLCRKHVIQYPFSCFITRIHTSTHTSSNKPLWPAEKNRLWFVNMLFSQIKGNVFR